jgi:YVTN family beta-propeller protein
MAGVLERAGGPGLLTNALLFGILLIFISPVALTLGSHFTIATSPQAGEITELVAPSPATPAQIHTGAPYVGYTLDLCTNVLYSGNNLPSDCGGSNPEGAVYDSSKSEIFVASSFTNNVTVISDSKNKVVASIPVGINPAGAVYDSGKGEIFVANYGSNSVSVISDSSNTVVTTVTVGTEPWDLAYDTLQGVIFVTNQGSGTVSVISDETNKVVSTITVKAEPWGVAFDIAQDEAFVANQGANDVSLVEAANYKVIQNISVGKYPNGVTYDNLKGEIFVANQDSSTVSVINDETNLVTATINVGTVPWGLTYDSADGYIFVANWGSGNVSVISDSTTSVTSTVTVGTEPEFPAYDATTGLVYVTNYIQGTVSIISTIGVVGTLSSVSVVPTSASIATNKTTSNFTATATCVSTCPNGLNYTWSLSNSAMGTIGAATAQSTAFTAGGTAGTVTLTVTAALNGTTVKASATITITSSTKATLSSVAITPTTASLISNGQTSFNATPTCTATCPSSGISYAWALTNSALGTLSTTIGSMTSFTAGTTAGTVGLFVNASLNVTIVQSLAAIITVTTSSSPLISVSQTPNSASMASGGTQSFTANPTCSSTCPSGIAYSWALTRSVMGTLSATTGSPVTFTAGNTVGTVGLFVNASYSGITKQSSVTVITVTGAPPTILGAVTITPSQVTLSSGSAQIFTAEPTCTSGGSSVACPSKGITYSWSLNSNDGNLSSTTNPSTTFTAGNTGIVVTLSVKATLNGISVPTAATITITASAPPPAGVNLSGDWGFILLAALLVVVTVLIYTMAKRRSASDEAAAGETYGSPDAKPGDSGVGAIGGITPEEEMAGAIDGADLVKSDDLPAGNNPAEYAGVDASQEGELQSTDPEEAHFISRSSQTKCPKCGGPLDSDMVCQECGEGVLPSQASPPAEPMIMEVKATVKSLPADDSELAQPDTVQTVIPPLSEVKKAETQPAEAAPSTPEPEAPESAKPGTEVANTEKGPDVAETQPAQPADGTAAVAQGPDEKADAAAKPHASTCVTCGTELQDGYCPVCKMHWDEPGKT